MIRVTTENSAYEIDQEGKRIRRVRGTAPVTGYMPEEGDWKEFTGISGGTIGSPLTIIWDDKGEDPVRPWRCTVTSLVILIEEIPGDVA